MKLKKFIISSLLAFASLTFTSNADAASVQTHRVQKGDTLWKIGMNYGVSVSQLKRENHRTSDLIYIGEILKIPQTISAYEKDLLARLVEAEAKGEAYAGKVAVATVVLNRVDSDLFPNSISEVIYQKDQFTPVKNGTIYNPASEASKKAVNEALVFRGQGRGSLYFYNPQKTSNSWLRSKQVTVVIGNHVFAK
ncbi:cell wall hydrolase [Bacillus alveayuensis]|jgi:N-acetylmuramoyl-L-alanine amidase|uniref:cell wall hydrolase n=1 Tax=Aeribacillus alveayuensis TaxID=279215 RepID=UPI000696BA4E|nr:cell wall hydrolase [Bacillus alveayuensis]